MWKQPSEYYSTIARYKLNHSLTVHLFSPHFLSSFYLQQFFRSLIFWFFFFVFFNFCFASHYTKKKIRILGGTGKRQNGNFLQKRIPDSVPFPCRTQGHRSEFVPNSVHQLRPGIVLYFFTFISFFFSLFCLFINLFSRLPFSFC